MRVTEIVQPERNWSPLRLHRRLTVISGEQRQLAEVVSVLGSLYSQAGSTVHGTVEFAGLQMPLDQTAVVSLDLHGSGLRTLDSAAVDDTLASVRAAVTEASRVRLSEVSDSVEALESQLSELARRKAASEAAIEACDEEIRRGSEALETLREDLGAARSAPGELDGWISEARAVAQQFRTASGAAQERLDDLVAILSPESPEILSLRLGSTSEAHRSVGAALDEAHGLGLLDAEKHEVLSRWLDAVATGDAPASASIRSLLSEVRSIEAEWEELTAVGVEGDGEVVLARAAAEEHLARFDALRELSESGLLAERARAEIDDAHESGDSDEELRVLGMYGFGSHLDYTIAVSTRSVNDAIEATVDRARAEMVRAEDVLAAERERAATERAKLSERRDDLRERIHAATGVEAESLTAVELEAIVEPVPELAGIAEAMRGAAGAMVVRAETAEVELADLVHRRENLVDPRTIEAEVTERAEQLEALQPLLERARLGLVEIESRSAQLTEELTGAEAEVRELTGQCEALSGGAGLSGTELATLVRAVMDEMAPPGVETFPVLLEDSFAGLGESATAVLDTLVEAGRDMQVVYVTDDPEIANWARRGNEDSVGFVRLGRRRWFGRRLARGGAGLATPVDTDATES